MDNLVVGYIAGLSAGVFCLGTCLPLFLPFLFSEKRNTKNSLLLVLEFSLGRLLGYLLFGVLFGIFGKLITSEVIHKITSFGSLIIGVIMILYCVSFIKKKDCECKKNEEETRKKNKTPLVVGFFNGIHICPPFIASLIYVFSLESVASSVSYFIMFFLGTSTFIIPTVFIGSISKFEWVRKVGQVSGIIIGFYFIYHGLAEIFG